MQEHRAPQSMFADVALLRIEDADRGAKAVAQISGAISWCGRRRPSREERHLLAGVAARLGGASRDASAGRVAIRRDEALDLAAEIIASADRLRTIGRDLEALALEGLEGLILEALLGAGPVARLV